MIISHRHRYIFVHCRKSAGSAVKVSLARDLGPRDLQIGGWADAINAGVRPNLRARLSLLNPHEIGFVLRSLRRGEPRDQILNRAVKRGWRRRHGLDNFPPAADMRAAFPREWADYSKFCIVRNPFDRMVSDYFYRTNKLDRRPPFSDFVDAMCAGDSLDGRVKLGYSNWAMYTIDDEIAVDHVLRFENLQADLERVLADIGLRWDSWLPRTKAGGSRPKDYRSLYTDADVDKVRALCAREIEAFGYDF